MKLTFKMRNSLKTQVHTVNVKVQLHWSPNRKPPKLPENYHFNPIASSENPKFNVSSTIILLVFKLTLAVPANQRPRFQHHFEILILFDANQMALWFNRRWGSRRFEPIRERSMSNKMKTFLSITIHLLQLLSNFSSQIGFVIIKIKFEIREIVFWHFWIASLNLKRFHAFLNNWMSTVSCVPSK